MDYWWRAAGLTLGQWVDRCLYDGGMTESTAAELRCNWHMGQSFAEWAKGGIPLSQYLRSLN